TAAPQSRALHFPHLNSELAQEIARRLRLAVVAREIARVVIGDAAVFRRWLEHEAALLHEGGQEGRVMEHGVIAAERPVLILQTMQDVRIGRHDAPERYGIERCDIASRKLLEGRLVAEPARDISAVALETAEHGEIHIRRLERLDQRAQRAL